MAQACAYTLRHHGLQFCIDTGGFDEFDESLVVLEI